MKFREKLVVSHLLVSLISVVTSLILINYLVRYFFVRIIIGRGISIIIPEAGTRFLNTVKGAILISGLLSLVISILVALFISNYILKPIKEMKDFARKISDGDFKVRVNKESDDELGELADSLNYMAFHLSEMEKMRSKLMQNISHDLRTPLASIKGYLEVVKDVGFSKEEKEQALSVIEGEIERLEKMVKDLTKLSSADSKTLPLEFTRVDIISELKKVFDSFLIKIKEKGLEGIFEAPDKKLFILGDMQKIKEIFSNLLDNSLKFTTKGFIKLTIREEKDKVVVTVEDSGIGISEDDLPHIFERFYKGSNSNDNSGMGIGLSIVKEYVYAHKGEISVESKVNEFTRFTVKLPKFA